MSATDRQLGACPHCNASIPTTRVLIEYQTSDGPSTYAECPECRDVVHPA